MTSPQNNDGNFNDNGRNLAEGKRQIKKTHKVSLVICHVAICLRKVGERGMMDAAKITAAGMQTQS
jgi:hypothetical protein